MKKLLLILWFALSAIGFNTLAEVQNTAETTINEVHLDSDGWKLIGEIRIPISKKRLPAVLLLHDAAGDRTRYEGLVEALNFEGIATLAIDLRAHGRSNNKGTFGKPYREKRVLLEGTENDVERALSFLANHSRLDSHRIGVVGASYSGELMAIAARKSGYQKAYVALSPGSFSDESIDQIDSSQVAWLFVRATQELPFFDPMFDSIRSKSHTAEIKIIEGKAHATRLLTLDSSLADYLARWLSNSLK